MSVPTTFRPSVTLATVVAFCLVSSVTVASRRAFAQDGAPAASPAATATATQDAPAAAPAQDAAAAPVTPATMPDAAAPASPATNGQDAASAAAPVAAQDAAAPANPAAATPANPAAAAPEPAPATAAAAVPAAPDAAPATAPVTAPATPAVAAQDAAPTPASPSSATQDAAAPQATSPAAPDASAMPAQDAAATPAAAPATPDGTAPATQDASAPATPIPAATPEAAPAAQDAATPATADADASKAPAPAAPATTGKPLVASNAASKKGAKVKVEYTGPTAIVIVPGTPMLDSEGKQRLDPDGKPLFNPPSKQIRDKKGHPVFDAKNQPVFQTANNLGYDDKGKKIIAEKVKPPKTTPVTIASGTLTVDGWTGKAALNYDISDLKFMYVYAPGIGTTIVSPTPFPGAKEQKAAFTDKSLKITVDGHPIEVASDKRMLGKKEKLGSAWVAVDRSFMLPTRFPVFGYGTTMKAPYQWPGAKQQTVVKAYITPPPLPKDLRPTLLLTGCPAGMMRPAGPVVLPGQIAPEQPCVPIKSVTTASAKLAPPATAAPNAQPETPTSSAPTPAQ